jgi:hypothetical protein
VGGLSHIIMVIGRTSLFDGARRTVKVEGVKDAFWILSAISFRGLN